MLQYFLLSQIKKSVEANTLATNENHQMQLYKGKSFLSGGLNTELYAIFDLVEISAGFTFGL